MVREHLLDSSSFFRLLSHVMVVLGKVLRTFENILLSRKQESGQIGQNCFFQLFEKQLFVIIVCYILTDFFYLLIL